MGVITLNYLKTKHTNKLKKKIKLQIITILLLLIVFMSN